MSLRKKRKPDITLVFSRFNSINVSRLSFPILSSSVSSSSCSLHDSQTIYHAQSTFVSDTDTVFEDIDNSSHYLPKDVDEDNARHGGSTQSHRARQLKLAEGWSSIWDSIIDGMVQQAALPPGMVCHLCGKDASLSVWSTCLFLYIVCWAVAHEN